jgi:CRP/FNR family transcriptional regulator
MSLNLSQIFPQFDSNLVDNLEQVGQVREFEEGEILMRPGQYLKSSILILEGRVKISREGEDGEEFFLYNLTPGNLCALSMICSIKNEVSLLKGRAMSSGKALLIPIHRMDSLMMDHRQWFYFLLETYRSKFSELIEVIDQVAF